MTRISDVMTQHVITVTPDTTLREAADLFARHHISGAPVLAGHEVVGVVSAADLLEFVSSHYAVTPELASLESAAGGEEPGFDIEDEMMAINAAQQFREGDGEGGFAPFDDGLGNDLFSDHTVNDVMSREVWSLPPSAPLSDAARFMLDKEIHRLVVLRRGHLAGVITMSDLARTVAFPIGSA